jgi:hypothetical protein
MSLFGWMLVYAGLALIALGTFALMALRLWRKIKSVGHDISEASHLLGDIGALGTSPRR